MAQKEYKAVQIPTKKDLLEKKIQEAFVMASISLNRVNLNPFSEIDLETKKSQDSRSQKIKPIADEKRKLFNTMRQINRISSSYGAGRGAIFFKQASFMESFEDDYGEQVPFSSYYPYYQMLSHGQLRTYFTWRTQVRKGSIAETSLSYAFMYVYELLNNVGVDNPQDGLEKLVGFWLSYREFDDTLDRYLLQWIKEYIIYYPVEWSFHDFTEMYDLKSEYPSVYGYTAGKEDSFKIYAGISKYDIRRSIFYDDRTSRMIHLCFYYMLENIRKIFREKELYFDDYVFFSFDREYHWSPFGSALFHPYFKQGNRKVIISKRESYTCKDNRWTNRTPFITDEGKLLIGYIMKEMEVSLRKIRKFRYKIKADINKCDRLTIDKLTVHDIDLTKVIQESVREFYALFTRKIVKVNHNSLKQIRKDALDTQEKLIIPEDIDVVIEEPEPILNEVSVPYTDVWSAFKDSLSDIELETLSLIAGNYDIKNYAMKKGVMAGVLVDTINEKAMDHIGDVILDFGDTAEVFEDYIDELKEMVEK